MDASRSLREHALDLLVARDPQRKIDGLARGELDTAPIGSGLELAEPPGIPGRPQRPELVDHAVLKQRSVKTREGHAALIHAVAHIELNAVDLALDAIWRFPGLPDAFYRDWLVVAREEAQHFALLRDHLATLGFAYGDFPAHRALWEMAERTRADVLARVALVPRTLEARGLDASPQVKAKLLSIGDAAGAAIIDVLLRDEIGHVATGNRWYAWLCRERGVDSLATYRELAERHAAPRPRPPFNTEARRAAGFSDAELAALLDPAIG
ncbi:ferritin-like domain-containing protein [Schlegelella sp. ID0723]|uniref:Ferritin-like domain-containing protein n=1 Tax=Piscinibacter koreensis TaxID=2742824 RepID=A0A7Y6NKZ6_9BURK|nr:ferritin-like domain-containing protein [Schlegelella koreensis]